MACRCKNERKTEPTVISILSRWVNVHIQHKYPHWQIFKIEIQSKALKYSCYHFQATITMWTIQLRASSTPFPGNPFMFHSKTERPGKLRHVRERQDRLKASRPPVSHTDLKTPSLSLVRDGDTDICWSQASINSSEDFLRFCQASV